MAITVRNKEGKSKTLLNPHEKKLKFQQELKLGVKRTNDGKYKLDSHKKAIRLNAEEKAWRSGYISASIDSAKAYYGRREKKKKSFL